MLPASEKTHRSKNLSGYIRELVCSVHYSVCSGALCTRAEKGGVGRGMNERFFEVSEPPYGEKNDDDIDDQSTWFPMRN